ncbi:MAG: L,D-transpeptidase family protein [Chthoniobacterales bacterium]|nr:L,D-transpeptidase family protein [Chthoniobacterales bacterium]
MNSCIRLIISATLFVSISAFSEKAPANKGTRTSADVEAATRLQVFLDRANFGPGKLDGYYGDFTRKALALYRESRGEQPEQPADPKSNAAPDVRGLNLASVDPVFITYTVTEADMQNVGEVPEAVAEQAKLKALPYRDVLEAIGEKFHSDVDFIAQLNPDKPKETIKPGDVLKLPNVEPFDFAVVKDLKPGSEISAHAPVNDIADNESPADAPPADSEKNAPPAPAISVTVDTKTSMLAVRENDKIVAAYPVTIGSEYTVSPIGDWKVRGVAKLPPFRYDEQMLNHGERSEDFHMLPPGPNSPVGVMWIALNKEGIGLHGTNEPDEIGRSASHGCVRLANWDIVRLAGKVKGGVPVAIH